MTRISLSEIWLVRRVGKTDHRVGYGHKKSSSLKSIAIYMQGFIDEIHDSIFGNQNGGNNKPMGL